MKLLRSSLICACIIIPVVFAQGGYYWRSYKGTIPQDALAAGKDEDNHTIYIGMTQHSGYSVLPGTIYPKLKKVVYELGLKGYASDLDALILCTQHKEQFTWVKVQTGMPLSVVTKNNELEVIEAGSENKRPLLIGRTILPRNDTVIGKVLVVDEALNYMWVTRNERGWHVTDYEVLVFNPNVNTESSNRCTESVIGTTVDDN